MNKPIDLIRLIRPVQWIKNSFVFAGILFSEKFTKIPLLIEVILVAIAFSLMSSAIYVINDIIDCEIDKMHETKKYRPLASGKVTIPVAIGLSMLCALGSLVLASMISVQVFAIVIAYMVLNIAYTLYFKDVVILDVFCIAAGFMLRIFAGTIGVGITPTNWLLLCGLMLTLFLGFAKRRAEIIALKGDKEKHRKVLSEYGPILLDEISAICAAGVIISYGLYTTSPTTIQLHRTENLIYTVPFVIYALFRYIFLLHHAHSGENPAKDLFTDKHIIVSIVGWMLLTVYLIKK